MVMIVIQVFVLAFLFDISINIRRMNKNLTEFLNKKS